MNAHACAIDLENLLESGSTAVAPAAQQLAAEAHEAFLRGDVRRVRACLGAALELSPGNGELALALGHAEMSAGNLEAALAAYWNATLISPHLASAHSNHALVLQLLSRLEEASRDALRALSLDPTDLVALKVLARIHLNAGQHEAAQQACRLILEQDEQDSEARHMFEEAIIQEAKLGEILPQKPEGSQIPAVAAPPRIVPPLVKPPKNTARTF
ncbi:MAG: tetratricopeptide repeat protein [Verrucomicrobiota bacterium]|jgi:tetratricopeptide (TPR) repeat protein